MSSVLSAFFRICEIICVDSSTTQLLVVDVFQFVHNLTFLGDVMRTDFSESCISLVFVVMKLFVSLAVFSGKAESDGRMHVTLCDYIMPWDSLSNTQKKSLSQRYQMGCDCKVRRRRKRGSCLSSVCECAHLMWEEHHDCVVCLQIVRCPSLPCEISAPEDCLWTDLIIEKKVYGRQASHYACVKRADGSCSWYRGVALPKKEFLDSEDP